MSEALASDGADNKPAPKALSMKQRRDDDFQQNLFSGVSGVFLGVLGPPIFIPLAYYVFGWQIAVLMLPVLMFISSKRMPKSQQSRSRFQYWTKSAFRLSVLSLPIVAIALNREAVMRLWPLFIGLGMILTTKSVLKNMYAARQGLVRKYFKLTDAFIRVLFLASFIGLSELMWHFFGIQGWIWFHALFLFNMVFLALGIGTVVVWLLSRNQEVLDDNRTKGRLPRKETGDETEQFDLSIQHADFRVTYYENARLSHAHKIFRQIDWASEAKEYSTKAGRWTNDPNIVFAVGMGHGFYFNTLPKEDDSFEIQAGYITGNRRQKKLINLQAVAVPEELIEGWMELAWKSDWGTLYSEMEPFQAK